MSKCWPTSISPLPFPINWQQTPPKSLCAYSIYFFSLNYILLTLSRGDSLGTYYFPLYFLLINKLLPVQYSTVPHHQFYPVSGTHKAFHDADFAYLSTFISCHSYPSLHCQLWRAPCPWHSVLFMFLSLCLACTSPSVWNIVCLVKCSHLWNITSKAASSWKLYLHSYATCGSQPQEQLRC